MDFLSRCAVAIWRQLGPASRGWLIDVAFFVYIKFLAIRHVILFLFTVWIDPMDRIRQPINVFTRRGEAKVFLLAGSRKDLRLLAFFWREQACPRWLKVKASSVEGAVIFPDKPPLIFHLGLEFDTDGALATLTHAKTSGGDCIHPARRVDCAVMVETLAPILGRNCCPNILD